MYIPDRKIVIYYASTTFIKVDQVQQEKDFENAQAELIEM